MTDVHIELWRDASGVEWELVQHGLDEVGGACIVRERNLLDAIDGDSREGFHVIARFGDPEDARAWLAEEGFDPVA
jgi:uncharacterized protein (DUF1330 family)